MPIYVIKQGDTLSRIARDHKLPSWRTIYDHAQNADFRAKRSNPNLIYPGDEVFVPDMELGEESGSVDQKHKFEVNRAQQVLRIAVEDEMGNRIKNSEYELVIEGKTRRGNTNSQGLLEEKISSDTERARLKVGGNVWNLLIGHLNPIESDTADRGVSGAQGRLRNLGYDTGEIDGIMGPITKAALEAFQSDERLSVTGELDSATREALVRVHNI